MIRVISRPLALSLLLLATVAHARTGPNPGGRELPGTNGAVRVAPARLAQPASTMTVVPVPLPAGAVQIDSTYYDFQDFGSLGTRIVVGADARVHLTWMDDDCELDGAGCPPNLSAPQPFPERGMNYAVRDAFGTWTRLGKVKDPGIRNCCLTELLGGFGTIAVTPDGRAAISQHMNEDGCDERGDFYLENAVGGSSYTAYLTPIIDPSPLFPQVVALPNGSFVVLGEIPHTTSDCLHCGTNDFKVSRLAAAGAHFVCPTGWQCGNWASVAPNALFQNGYPAFPTMAAASDGRVGIAVTDFGGNVFLIESTNGTFNAGTIVIRKITTNVTATVTASDSTSTQYRPYVNCALAYNDTTPNVVWSELQARKNGSAVAYADYHSRIQHWSSTTGITTVKQVQAGEADTYDNVDNGNAGPLAGFNTISVDWPQVGFSADGSETYVAWLRFTDAEIDTSAHAGQPAFFTGVGFGDVAASVRRGAGAWSAPQNLTATPNTDERYFSLAARNDGGLAHLVFQASATNQAGSAVAEDRGTSPGNLVRRIAYLERTLAGSLVAVGDPARGAPLPTLRVSPNPSRGHVRFAIDAARRGGNVLVFSVSGALVARVPVLAGGFAEWDGRDLQSRPIAGGVYFARLEGAGPAAKLLVMR